MDKKTSEVSLGATLYEINKEIMKKESVLSKDKIEEIQGQLETWFNWYADSYVMLLCRERYDFTVFHMYAKHNSNPPKLAAKELIELLKERGQILSMEKEIDDNKWEIWLKINKKVFAYYLFPCDDFIIEC